MFIRKATIKDLKIITAVEQECFPAAEAATEEDFRERLERYGDHFWLLFIDNILVSFADGFVTDERDLTDRMYEDVSMHNENGDWQMIFGVNTLPAYRKQGLAGTLINRIIDESRQNGRKGIVLTCKKELIHYYSYFGFINEGVTLKSTHGGVTWYQMRLTLKDINDV